MPLTPFHLGFAWPVWLLNRKKLHFMSLSFGAMVPDLEVLPLMLLNEEGAHARGLMHSLLGALTFDILVVMFIVFFVVPPVGRWVKRRSRERWHIFVIIDMFTHVYNPIWWPYFTDRDINWMPFSDPFLSSLAFMIPLGTIALVLALRFWTRPFRA